MQLPREEKQMYMETVDKLKGSDRRIYMARVVKTLGWGGNVLQKPNWAGVVKPSSKAATS